MSKQILIFIISALFLVSDVSAQRQKSVTPDEVLQKVFIKLSSLKTLKYQYLQEYNYASEAYFAESKAESYLEFTSFDSVLGLKFRFENPNGFIAYNGTEIFILNKKDKTIKVESKPKIESLTSSSYLQFSPLMWRNALPKIISDKTIPKKIGETEINNISYYLVEFVIDKAYIDSGNGEIKPLTLDRKTVYRLTVDKKNFMPIEVYRGNNINQDFNKTTFSEIVENPPPPTENSWYYSTYLNEYKYAEQPKDNLIKAGETAFEISLPLFGTNKMASLSQFKGKVVLLDFWIFHCGSCQSSVPKLNALQRKYKDKDFVLLTVNVTDSEKQIQLFIEKTKSEFPILHQGEVIAKKYGVLFFPTVVLIGKDGKVVYSGVFDQAKIAELIDKKLSEK
ncbi:MAG TPA: TlpA disulfide reductase family protein [Pyrinomonadaceae bacterium]|nr:TlpA disulfide reductase family protein [Pyrinomonadaceae bacterium]